MTGRGLAHPLDDHGTSWGSEAARSLTHTYSRLTAARALETAQHVLMREAIMKTSGLTERLRAAQDALRESVA